VIAGSLRMGLTELVDTAVSIREFSLSQAVGSLPPTNRRRNQFQECFFFLQVFENLLDELPL
jgi:hypothetical protein